MKIPLGFIRKNKKCFEKISYEIKYFSYEKLTLFKTYQNRRTAQYQFFHFIWKEKIS